MGRIVDLWGAHRVVNYPVKVTNRNWDIEWFEVLAVNVDPTTGYPHACGFAKGRNGNVWGTGTIIQPTDEWELAQPPAREEEGK